ncbi:hypothetical protein BD769DRAFT_1387874 [Suillus cothurnatus]|nr:hypothetical protein BD769DRAFT_1387874 [Suillus cothurnatus]
MYSGAGDPQYNFIRAQVDPGYHDFDDQLQQPAPSVSFSMPGPDIPVAVPHPNLTLTDFDVNNTAGYRYHYLHDQPEQEPVTPSFPTPNHDPFLLQDAQASSRRNLYPTSSSNQLPASLNEPSYPSGDPSCSDGLSASSQVDTLPYPNILDAHANYHDSYATVTDTDNNSSMIFSSAPSLQLTTIDPHAGTMFPDPNIGARTSYHDTYATGENPPAFRVESAPVSTMPDSEDVMPLHAGQPLPLDQPLCFDAPRLRSPLPAGEACRSQPSRKRRQGDLFIPFDPHQKKIRGWAAAKDVSNVAASSTSSSKPLVAASEENTPQRSGVGPAQYDESHPVHKQIVDMALGIVIGSVVNVSPFLSEDERKQEVHSALTMATRCFADVDAADLWTSDNESTLYKILSAPSANVMAVARKHAHHLVPRGYGLCLPLSSNESEPVHQAQRAKALLKPSRIPKYLFKEGESMPFGNEVIQDIVQNTIGEIVYQPYVTQLDGLKSGGNNDNEFSAKEFKPVHTMLMNYIKTHITPYKQRSEWWENHKSLTLRRLTDIYAFQSKLKAMTCLVYTVTVVVDFILPIAVSNQQANHVSRDGQ